MTHHPFRDAALHMFERQDSLDGGAAWIARFHPYDTYPVFFSGSTESAARAQAEAFRADAVAKHEASFINRQAAIEKARQTRQAKKEAAE
tara:strand:- start:479 stop:748 length:270 start_codon:yes stop_codon:yes gene_type:complete